jgi:hypothetical protein
MVMSKVLGVDAPADGLDPMRAVLQEIGFAASACRWLREQIAELDPAEAIWGIVQEAERGSGPAPGRDTTRAARPHVLVELLGVWSDRLVGHCATAGRLGIDQSMIAVVEAHGLRAAVVLERLIASEPEISSDVRQRMLASLPDRLEEMEK